MEANIDEVRNQNTIEEKKEEMIQEKNPKDLEESNDLVAEKSDSGEEESEHPGAEGKEQRKLTLCVRNLPLSLSGKAFKNWVKSLSLAKLTKSKKTFNMGFCHLTFEDIESKEIAKEKINKETFKGKKLSAVDSETDKGKLRLEKKRQRSEAEEQQANKKTKDAKSEDTQESITQNLGKKQTVEDVSTPWHSFTYEQQIKKKRNAVIRYLRRTKKCLLRESKYNIPEWIKKAQGTLICKLSNLYESPVKTGYRNKNAFSVGYNEEGKVQIGFLLGTVKEGIYSVGDASGCSHLSKPTLSILSVFQNHISSISKLPPYNKQSTSGFWRQVTIRTPSNTHDIMTIIQVSDQGITNEQVQEEKEMMISTWKSFLEKYFTPENQYVNVKHGLFLQVWNGISNAAPWDCPIEKLYGDDYITEVLCKLTFRISPASFFQVNTLAAELLQDKIKELCGINRETILLDLYCGTGTFGLILANHCKKVIGIEEVQKAIEDAQVNCKINNITNAEFISSKVETCLKDVLSSIHKEHKQQQLTKAKDTEKTPEIPNDSFNIVAIVDPPRAGLHLDAIKAIRMCTQLSRLVYVSCNPESMITDVAHFCRSSSKTMLGSPFVPIYAFGVDMFPQTPHLELVVLLERNTPTAEAIINGTLIVGQTKEEEEEEDDGEGEGEGEGEGKKREGEGEGKKREEGEGKKREGNEVKITEGEREKVSEEEVKIKEEKQH